MRHLALVLGFALTAGCLDAGVSAHPGAMPYRLVKTGTTDEQRDTDFKSCTDEVYSTVKWTTNLPGLRLDCMQRKGYHVDTYAGPASR